MFTLIPHFQPELLHFLKITNTCFLGALNEAFSDMAGETAKALMLGQNDWHLGYDATKDEKEPLR